MGFSRQIMTIVRFDSTALCTALEYGGGLAGDK